MAPERGGETTTPTRDHGVGRTSFPSHSPGDRETLTSPGQLSAETGYVVASERERERDGGTEEVGPVARVPLPDLPPDRLSQTRCREEGPRKQTSSCFLTFIPSE